MSDTWVVGLKNIDDIYRVNRLYNGFVEVPRDHPTSRNHSHGYVGDHGLKNMPNLGYVKTKTGWEPSKPYYKVSIGDYILDTPDGFPYEYRRSDLGEFLESKRVGDNADWVQINAPEYLGTNRYLVRIRIGVTPNHDSYIAIVDSSGNFHLDEDENQMLYNKRVAGISPYTGSVLTTDGDLIDVNGIWLSDGAKASGSFVDTTDSMLSYVRPDPYRPPSGVYSAKYRTASGGRSFRGRRLEDGWLADGSEDTILWAWGGTLYRSQRILVQEFPGEVGKNIYRLEMQQAKPSIDGDSGWQFVTVLGEGTNSELSRLPNYPRHYDGSINYGMLRNAVTDYRSSAWRVGIVFDNNKRREDGFYVRSSDMLPPGTPRPERDISNLFPRIGGDPDKNYLNVKVSRARRINKFVVECISSGTGSRIESNFYILNTIYDILTITEKQAVDRDSELFRFLYHGNMLIGHNRIFSHEGTPVFSRSTQVKCVEYDDGVVYLNHMPGIFKRLPWEDGAIVSAMDHSVYVFDFAGASYSTAPMKHSDYQALWGDLVDNNSIPLEHKISLTYDVPHRTSLGIRGESEVYAISLVYWEDDFVIFGGLRDHPDKKSFLYEYRKERYVSFKNSIGGTVRSVTEYSNSDLVVYLLGSGSLRTLSKNGEVSTVPVSQQTEFISLHKYKDGKLYFIARRSWYNEQTNEIFRYVGAYRSTLASIEDHNNWEVLEELENHDDSLTIEDGYIKESPNEVDKMTIVLNDTKGKVLHVWSGRYG